ncbi:hypothetical protein BESB_083940 [Besnoitia besnoiti]|uniref:Uncharacterized protein n=1 Tax=Besnoitia besnoiti TaxID=94643 RepID=A0A2A9M5F7_BESBE|nr:hypothetical protein BESB_083940 [Besnoitia besnoiti]PFH33195.1 hypothetical protein BESB_083940 [Besnoitia besnoiti]
MAASAVTADVRREFVQTCLLTKAGLAAATRSLLHGLSWRQIVRETKRDLGRALGLRAKEPTDSAASCAAAPAVLSTSGAGALGGASAPTGADSPSLLSLKEVAATVWSAERDLCAALQTVLLQLIAMTLSRASEPAFTASDSNEWTCVRVQGGQDAAAAADRFAVRSSRDGQSEWTEQDRAPLGFAASNTSAAVRFTFLSLPRQAPRGSAAWDGPETGPLSHSRQWRAGELRNLRSATLTSRHPAARAPAAPASLFQELLEASQTPAGEAGGEAPFLPQNRRESPENICAPSGEEVRSDVEVGPATEEHRMEHERRGGKDCKHSDAGGEGPCGRQLIAETPVEPCEVPRLLLPPGSAPARPAWLRCPVRSRRVAATDTQPQRSSDPRTAAALSRASDQLAESLAAAFNWVVAWFARLLHALECFGSLSAAAWSAARQLVAVGLTLGMAERELESSVGRLRMALLFEWTRLSAAGVRPPTHLFPSLHAPAAAAASGASFPSVASSFAPASSSSASGRPTAVGPSCEGAGGASRGAKLAAVLPCALRPPAVSPLFRESSSLQSPGDLRLGLGRLNQHVAAALALLRLGPELSASSSSFLPPLPLSAAEGGRGEEATGLAFAQRHLCPRCRANDSKKDAEGLLARRCADLDKFRQLGLAEGRVGPNNEGDGTRNEGDTLDDGAADEEWITVLQATQQQLGFARQSCDRALGLFVKRAQARRGQERDAAADPTGEAAEARAGETASSGDNGGRHGTPGEPRDAPARLAALPAPPQEFLEIYKGLGEEASRPGSAAGSLLLFSDDVDEATLAKGRAAMSELKRVFLSHPRMQRQRQQKRVVKELVPTGATPGGSSAQRRPGAGAAACHDRERARCGLNATAADEDGGPRLRLEVREEEGEEDEGRMQNAYWRRVGGAGPGGLPEPCEGSHSEAPGGDSNAAARWRDEDEREGRDRPRPTEDDVGPTESDSAGVRPSSSSSPAPRVSHPGEMAVRRSAPSTDTGSGASVRCLLSGVGLGITTPEALRLESRRQREAEKPPGTQSLFAELAGQFSRARASVAETSEGGTPQSRPADGTEIAGRLADVGEVSGQQRVWGGAFGLMQTNHFLMASAGGSRETGAVSFPAVFAHLAKGESGEEAFCGLGEAEDEEEEDDAEPPGLSHGEGFGGREASEESVSRDLGERESRSEGESVRHGGHHCGSDWGGGAWCLEGRSDDEETKMDAEARQD